MVPTLKSPSLSTPPHHTTHTLTHNTTHITYPHISHTHTPTHITYPHTSHTHTHTHLHTCTPAHLHNYTPAHLHYSPTLWFVNTKPQTRHPPPHHPLPHDSASPQAHARHPLPHGSSSGRSYSSSDSCEKYGAKHHCVWEHGKCSVGSSSSNFVEQP